jgi:hypothetical protein
MLQTRDPEIRRRHSGACHLSAPHLVVSQDDLCLRYIARVSVALLSACLAPAFAMAALWSAENIGRSAFVMTFGVALGHAILLGLPLFLILLAKRWVNAETCIVAGFAIGAAPAAVLSWPTQHPHIHTAALITDWVSYLAPPVHFGMFGALAGAAFWLVLSSFGVSGIPAVYIRFLQSRRVRA